MNQNSAERMPAGIPFIVANEFAERFCYYGVNSILAVYMTQHLHFGEAQATVWQSMFKSGAYLAPLIGAIMSDVFWGKFKTIMTLALVYCLGCGVIAMGHGGNSLALGLFLMAVGTGGIKPCVSTNVGDQFSEKSQHLIERAFSYFYLSINAGSSISIWFCPIWLDAYGPLVAFGVPALSMLLATFVFWFGRDRYVVVPPAVTEGANKGMAYFIGGLLPVLYLAYLALTNLSPDYRVLVALLTLVGGLILMGVVSLNTGLRNKLPPQLVEWMAECFTGPALKQMAGLALIYYVFVAMFWSLWDQSNGQTWTLQATSDLMDKHPLGFLSGVPALSALASYEVLPSQIQVVNGWFILGMVPIFSFFIYPFMGRFFTVTPLRKIGIGLFVIASSYLVMALIENRIMHGVVVSMWWQILAYMVLTAAEVLISITALEFSYKQAPLRAKSFIMAATYLLSVSVGNAFTAQINSAMVESLPVTSITAGTDTWVGIPSAAKLQPGQKVDFDGSSGIQVASSDGQPGKLEGTYLVAEIDTAANRVRLADVIHRQSVVSTGEFKGGTEGASTYKLVGPMYFLFFAAAAAAIAVLFVFVAGFYREQTHVRNDKAASAA